MLLNNYYIIRKSMDAGQGFYNNNHPMCSNNYFHNYSIEEAFKLRLGSGNTIKQVYDTGNFGYFRITSAEYGYQMLTSPERNEDSNTGYIHIGIINSVSYIADCYRTSSLQDSWSNRDLYGYLQQQTPTDFAPATLFYKDGYWYSRFKDFIRVAAGSLDDSTPVNMNDYNLTGMYDLNDINISASAPCNGIMVITLYNNTDTEKTIREFGIYDCRLKCHISFGSSIGTTKITDLTNEQKQILETSLARVTDWPIKFNTISENNSTRYGKFDIPILVSKTKLTTPIILQPGETKAVTYEIKY